MQHTLYLAALIQIVFSGSLLAALLLWLFTSQLACHFARREDTVAVGGIVRPLMRPQIDIGGRVGGDPRPAGADVYLRRHIGHIVFLVPDVAFGNHVGKLPENAGDPFGSGAVFRFPRAKPAQLIIKQPDDRLHIVFAVVLMKQKAGHLPDPADLFFAIKRSCHRLSPMFEALFSQQRSSSACPRWAPTGRFPIRTQPACLPPSCSARYSCDSFRSWRLF